MPTFPSALADGGFEAPNTTWQEMGWSKMDPVYLTIPGNMMARTGKKFIPVSTLTNVVIMLLVLTPAVIVLYCLAVTQ